MTRQTFALLATALLMSGCSTFAPEELDNKTELEALTKAWGGKAAGHSILIVPLLPRDLKPKEEEATSGPMRVDPTAFHQELRLALSRVLGEGDRVDVASDADEQKALSEAWRRDFDLILKVELKRWDAEFVETNGWWFPNALFLAWYLWPIGPQWWIADEDYGVNLELRVLVKDVASDQSIPSLGGRQVTVRSTESVRGAIDPLDVVPPPVLSLDDLDRGLDLFGTWISGSLNGDQWESVGEKLAPYARRHAAVRVAAAVADGLKRLKKMDPGIKSKLLATTHALVIGISEYPGAKVPGAVRDAERFQDLLRGKLPALSAKGERRAARSKRWAPDKNVIFLRNGEASLQGVVAALSQIKKRAKAEDRIVLYFAGSGWSRSAKGAAGLALRTFPTSGKGKRQGFTLAQLAKKLEQIKARQRLIVIDADFRKGPRGTGVRTQATSRAQLSAILRDTFLGGAGVGGGVVLATGLGQKEQVQTYEEQGLLTQYLVRGLQGEADAGNDGLTFGDLASYLDRYVHNLSAVALPSTQQPLVVGKVSSERVN